VRQRLLARRYRASRRAPGGRNCHDIMWRSLPAEHRHPHRPRTAGFESLLLDAGFALRAQSSSNSDHLMTRTKTPDSSKQANKLFDSAYNDTLT